MMSKRSIHQLRVQFFNRLFQEVNGSERLAFAFLGGVLLDLLSERVGPHKMI